MKTSIEFLFFLGHFYTYKGTKKTPKQKNFFTTTRSIMYARWRLAKIAHMLAHLRIAYMVGNPVLGNSEYMSLESKQDQGV